MARRLWRPRPWHRRFIANPSGGTSVPLVTTLTNLGLTSNLKLALDAGDASSYPGTGQSWLDTSGGGYDFFLGADGSATSSDPTFNGTAGLLSAGNYWSFDGGDWFTYDTTSEGWMDDIHQDNAVFTILSWIYMASFTGSPGVIGNMTLTTEVGFSHSIAVTTGAPAFTVVNGSGIAKAISGTSVPVSLNTWSMVAISSTEATGANGAMFYTNGATQLANSAYTSPSASAATNTLAIGAQKPAGTSPFTSGSRIAMLAVFSEALSSTQLDNIYNATRGRFGV